MSQDAQSNIDLEKEMEEVDEAIVKCNEMAESLNQRRYELIAMRQNLEIADVIECIIEKGINANQIMQMILSASEENKIPR